MVSPRSNTNMRVRAHTYAGGQLVTLVIPSITEFTRIRMIRIFHVARCACASRAARKGGRGAGMTPPAHPPAQPHPHKHTQAGAVLRNRRAGMGRP